jgi:hypothetical protein
MQKTSYKKAEYINLTKISNYEFNKRLERGELKKVGQGKLTEYVTTSLHTKRLIIDLEADLAKNETGVKKCDKTCNKCLEPGYAQRVAPHSESTLPKKRKAWYKFW